MVFSILSHNAETTYFGNAAKRGGGSMFSFIQHKKEQNTFLTEAFPFYATVIGITKTRLSERYKPEPAGPDDR